MCLARQTAAASTTRTKQSPFSLVMLGGRPARMACCRSSRSPCLAALYMRDARAMASGGRDEADKGAAASAPSLLIVKAWRHVNVARAGEYHGCERSRDDATTLGPKTRLPERN